MFIPGFFTEKELHKIEEALLKTRRKINRQEKAAFETAKRIGQQVRKSCDDFIIKTIKNF